MPLLPPVPIARRRVFLEVIRPGSVDSRLPGSLPNYPRKKTCLQVGGPGSPKRWGRFLCTTGADYSITSYSNATPSGSFALNHRSVQARFAWNDARRCWTPQVWLP
jgi:hypothetical protein